MAKKNSRQDFLWHLLAMLALALLLVPATGAAGGEEPQKAGAVVTQTTLSIANLSPPDPANLSEYRATPKPIRMETTLNETHLSVAKGEMASGPRFIGLDVNPMVLAAGIIVIAAIAIGFVYYLKRKKDSEDKE